METGGVSLSGGLIRLSQDLAAPSQTTAGTTASAGSTIAGSTIGGTTTGETTAGGAASSVSTASLSQTPPGTGGQSTSLVTATLGAASSTQPEARILSVNSSSSAATFIVSQNGGTLTLSVTSSGTDIQTGPAAGGATGTGLGVFTVSGDRTDSVGAFQVGFSSGNLTMAPAGAQAQQATAPAAAEPSATFKIATQGGESAEFGLNYTDGALTIVPLNASAEAVLASNGSDLRLVSATGLLQAQREAGVDIAQVRAVFLRSPS